MGKHNSRLVGAALGCALLTACAGAAGPASHSGQSFAPERSAARRISATVIDGEHIWRRGGNLLTALRSRVAGLQIRRTGGCPSISLRGKRTLVGPSNPQVYVNGARAVDTCILEMTAAEDVDRIEVYPMGVTGRPGVQNHPYGIILVFLRNGSR
ncbi:MAG TPA: Plug domain-containing protein [Longimicrobiaceae bacterium]|nr:Plug domain-containing protein [Longimicrobiaceae bacterium]